MSECFECMLRDMKIFLHASVLHHIYRNWCIINEFCFSLTKSLYTRSVRLYYPYRHYTNGHYVYYKLVLFQLSNTQIELSACYRDIKKLDLASEYPDTERRLVLETVLTRSSNMSLWWTCMVTSVSYLVLSIFVRSLVVTSINSLSMSKKYWFLCTMICKEMKKWKKKLTSFNLGNREC